MTRNASRVAVALLLFVPLLTPHARAEPQSPLAPLKTESPRDTMRTFMNAMDDYIRGVRQKDPALRDRIEDAVRTLDLSEAPMLSQPETGREAAIYLKEVMDRVILIDYAKIPGEANAPQIDRWRLKDTEITIHKVQSGARKGEWLFSPSTVSRAAEFFEKVRHMPYLEGTTEGAGYREPWLQRNLPRWAQKEFLAVRTWQWIGILVAVFVGLSMRAIAGFVGHLIQKLSSRTRTEWDERLVEALKGPVGLLAAAAIWYLSLVLLRLRGTPLTVMGTILQLVVTVGLIWLFYRLASVFAAYLRSRAERTHSRLDDQLVKLISSSLKTFVVILGILVGAQNLGIEVFSVLAGLGIGGLAVALAAKDTLANFFGSIMIMLDRPFQVGDWVVMGEFEGTVEDIGFRTTRIRTFHNSVISIPNSLVATGGVDNMGLREYRRVLVTVDITFDTPAEKVEAFCEGIKNIIKANPYTRKDYFHVVFNNFGESGLKVMLYFFLKVPDWPNELVERQNVLLEVIRLAERLGVEFAFPTRTLHVETFPEKQPVRAAEEVDPDRYANTAAAFGAEGDQARPAGSGLFVPPYREEGQKQ
ncbi:MAG: mechanosensitive ion channel family protein [Phycisphaerae bacterium]